MSAEILGDGSVNLSKMASFEHYCGEVDEWECDT